MSKKRILLLAGGDSAERDVSISTSDAMQGSLNRLGYDVTRDDVDVGLPQRIQKLRPDAVVLGLHGGKGENGVIQGLLELLEIPYTCSGVCASALAMDKGMTKQLLAGAGIPSPRWWTVNSPDQPWPAGERAVALKPLDDGSSVGVMKIESEQEWSDELPRALARGGRWMAESWVQGRELSVGFLDDLLLGAVEIRVQEGWYDYAAKYERDDTEYLVPAPLTAAQEQAVFDAAARTWGALGCRGTGRVDIMLDDQGPWVLEVNTLPGMTNSSLIPKLAALKGLSFDDLMEGLVNSARTDAGKRPSWVEVES